MDYRACSKSRRSCAPGISAGATLSLSGAPLGAPELGKQKEVVQMPAQSPEHTPVFPLRLAMVSAMSRHFHSHQILAVGEQKSTWLQKISLPPSQALTGVEKNQPQCYFAAPIGPQIGVDMWMNCFQCVRMQLFYFPSNSKLLIFRNKLLPVLLINKDKIRM